jgi:hypothetical protein
VAKKKANKKSGAKGQRWDKEDQAHEQLEVAVNVGGRPSKFSQELADKICVSLMEGKALRAVAAECDIHVTVIFQWLQTRPGFFDQYVKAREVQAELMADDLTSIADEVPEITTVTTSPTGSVSERKALDSAGVYRNRLRVDTRKWIAAKLLPKKYGDHLKLEASGPNGTPLPGVTVNLKSLSDGELEHFAQITAKLAAGNPSGAAQAT